MSNNSFVMFGCWNNLNEKKGKDIGCLKNVMKKLNDYIIDSKIEHIVVAGDNYYPDKKEVDGAKKKIIYTEKLLEGFTLLPKDINIDMIFGNHDLETNQGTNNNIYINNTETLEENLSCQITKYEMEAIKKEGLNIKLNLFDAKKINENTLLILLDTSIYSVDAKNYLSCYNYFLETIHGQTFETLEDLINFQETFIKTILTETKETIDNIIIVGHHPLAGLKTKIKKDKSIVVQMNDIHKMLSFVREMYGIVGEKQFYYLCADYHSYQKGFITLQLDDGKEMKITQYIVGTGGTKLDDELLSDKPTTYNDESNGLTYVMETNLHNCGFLVCNVNGGELEFIPLLLSETIGGKKTRKRYKKQKKIKKTKRRNRKYIYF